MNKSTLSQLWEHKYTQTIRWITFIPLSIANSALAIYALNSMSNNMFMNFKVLFTRGILSGGLSYIAGFAVAFITASYLITIFFCPNYSKGKMLHAPIFFIFHLIWVFNTIAASAPLGYKIFNIIILLLFMLIIGLSAMTAKSSEEK